MQTCSCALACPGYPQLATVLEHRQARNSPGSHDLSSQIMHLRHIIPALHSVLRPALTSRAGAFPWLAKGLTLHYAEASPLPPGRGGLLELGIITPQKGQSPV